MADHAHSTRESFPTTRWLVVVVLPTLVLLSLFSRNWLIERLGLWTLDLRTVALHWARRDVRLAPHVWPQPETGQLVLVSIDDETLSRLGERWPMPRRYLARFLDTMSKASADVVTVDLFLQSKSSSPEDDRMLREAIVRSGRAIFCQRWERKGAYSYARPTDPFFAEGMLGDASVFFLHSPDGLIRKLHVVNQFDGRALPSLALLTVVHHLRLSSAQITLPTPGVADDLVLDIDPEGRPGAGPIRIPVDELGGIHLDLVGAGLPFRQIPFHEVDGVLAREPDAFKNRIVVLGVTGSTFHDMHPVPIAFEDQTDLPGVVLHCFAIRDLLTGHSVRRVSQTAERILVVIFGGLSLLAALSLRLGRAILAFAALCLVWTSLATGLLLRAGLWVPLFAPVVGGSIVFLEGTLIAVQRDRRLEVLRQAILEEYVRRLKETGVAAHDPEVITQRMGIVKNLLSSRDGKTVERLQSLLPPPGHPVPAEISWGLAMAFLEKGDVFPALAHVAQLGGSALPLDDLYRLALALEQQGALGDAARVLQLIKARDLNYADVQQRLEQIETRDRQVPEALRLALSNRYTQVSFLGSGGMARVFAARDRVLDRMVAIKVPDEASLADVEACKRFKREIRALASLTHPNIIRIHDVSLEGTIFYAMELVTGDSLRVILETEGAYPEGEALELMGPIVSAIAYTHSRGIIHRDIKPENILVDQAQVPRLTDFGLAYLEEQTRLTQTSGLLGTPAYMAPEQIEGASPTARVDVYAVGLVLFEVITGKKPFGNAPAIQRLSTPAPRLRMFVPGVSEALEAVVARCLETDPAGRPADGAEVEALFAKLRCG